MVKKIKISDESGDKYFFTIVPNIIINHSSANDRALYLEMKRYAGENGKCFATEKTMMKRLKIGKKSYDKSLNYLLNKKWVEFVGFTEGRTRPIKTYRINDIWQQNVDYYKKISSERTLSKKDKFRKTKDRFQKNGKINAGRAPEEELFNKEKILRRDRDFAKAKSVSPLYKKTKTKKENSELYDFFVSEAQKRGFYVKENEGVAYAVRTRNAIKLLGLKKAKELIVYCLESFPDKPISYKTYLSDHYVINFKNELPLTYGDN